MIKGKFPFPSVSPWTSRRLDVNSPLADLSERKYRDLVETSNDLIWSVDEQGRFTFVNHKAALKIYGYEQKEMIGRPFTDFMSPLHAAAALKEFEQVKQGVPAFSYETVILRKDGSEAHLSANAIVVRDDDGDVIGATGTATDITERKKAEEERNNILQKLKAAREELELRVEERTQKLTEEIRIREMIEKELRHANVFLDSIIENIPDMIFLKDAQHLRFIRFNKAGEDLIGLSRGSMLDKNDFDFFPEEEAKFFTDKDREVLKNKKIVNIPEEPIHTVKGETRYLYTKKIPILDEQGEPLYLLGISEDITDKKLAHEKEKKWQEQILQSEKLSSIGLLAAGVAHELNNPLTGLISMLRGYRKRKNEDSEDYRELTEMLLASDHMAKVIEDLNDFSRMSSSQQEELDLYDVIESTLSFSEHQFRQNEIRVTKYYEKDVPKIRANKPQLQQVVLNLLMNAKDAIEKKGEVTIKTGSSDDGKTVVLEIIDTGCGISAEDLPRIFDPFFTTKVVGKGIGLGLSVLHGIVKNYNGEVLVDSQLGKGSKFTVVLPAAV